MNTHKHTRIYDEKDSLYTTIKGIVCEKRKKERMSFALALEIHSCIFFAFCLLPLTRTHTNTKNIKNYNLETPKYTHIAHSNSKKSNNKF